MASMRTPSPAKRASEGGKRTRKPLSLRQKVQILDELKKGVPVSRIARKRQIPVSTISSLRALEGKIRSTYQASPATGDLRYVSTGDTILQRVEKELISWLESEANDVKCRDSAKVRDKAFELYEEFAAQGGAASIRKFKASTNWYDNFRKRFANRRKEGEFSCPSDVENDVDEDDHDHEEASSSPLEDPFVLELNRYVEDKGLCRHQVFNAKETRLYFKRIGSREYMRSSEGLLGASTFTDRVSILLCSSASGDYKCKPVVVYKAGCPMSLRGKSKLYLPVVWRTTPNGLVSYKILEDWFHNIFVEEIKTYLASKGLPYKALLILSDAPDYSAHNLVMAHPDVSVLLIPSTSPLLQPMDRGVVQNFKSQYTLILYRRIQHVLESALHSSVMEFMLTYDICMLLDFIKETWDNIDPRTLKACWQSFFPCPRGLFRGFPSTDCDLKDILISAREIGLDGLGNLTEEELKAVLQSHEELVDRTDSMNSSVQEEGRGEEHPSNALKIHSLQSFLRNVEKLGQECLSIDPFLERSHKFRRGLEASASPYRDILRDLKWRSRQAGFGDGSALLDSVWSPSAPTGSDEIYVDVKVEM